MACCDVFGDVSEKVKHLTNDASNDVSPPALSRMVGRNKLCNPASDGVMIIRMIIYLSSDGLMIVRMIIYLTSDGVMMIRKPLPSGPGNRLANNWGKNLPLATLFGEIANRHYWTNSYLSNIRKFR